MATNPDQTSWTLGNNGFTTYDNFGMNFQGAWVSAVSYSLNDVVENNGSAYIVDVAHTSATTTEPGVGGTWTNFLSLLVDKGDTGSTGPAGTGDVATVGTPVDNQVGVWTGDGTLEGDTNFQWSSDKLTLVGSINLTDRANALADVSGVGQLWVKADTPDQLFFTDDDGLDTKVVLQGGAFHDLFSDFVAGEHFLQSAITEVGTIATGVWSGTAIGITKGGTGQTAKADAFNALSPTTTKGDVLVDNGSDVLRLAIGTDTHVLTADSTKATGVKWAAAPGGGGGGSQNLFETITGDSGTDPVADSTTDTLTIAGGIGITTVGTSGTDTLTIDFDINSLAADTPVLADTFAFEDTGGGDDNKATLTVLNSILNHDNLLGFVADEHVAHGGVTFTAGSGITGGGTIAANRTFDLDINSLAAATIVGGDFMPFWDLTATATNKKITLTDFIAVLEPLVDHDSLSGFVAGEHFLQSAITVVGTIGTGTWQGTAINQTYLVGQSGTNTGDEAVASLTVSGTVELATGAETNTGTDATRAVTPDGLEDWTGSAQVTTVGTIGTGTWQGTAINQTYLVGQSGTNTGDAPLDINALSAATIVGGDFIPFWDLTATADNKKITLTNFITVLEPLVSHDNLGGIVANEHIDWTNASAIFHTTARGSFGGGTNANIKLHARTGGTGANPHVDADEFCVESSGIPGGMTILTDDDQIGNIFFGNGPLGAIVGSFIQWEYRDDAVPTMRMSTNISGGVLELGSGAGTVALKIAADQTIAIGGFSPSVTDLHIFSSDTDDVPSIEIEQLSTGDAAIQFSIPGHAYAMGIDNSDGDKFKIAYAAGHGDAVLGTNARFIIAPDGSIGLNITNPQTTLHILNQTSSTLPRLEIEQTSTGDAALQFTIVSHSYAMGIDNTDDIFKISYASTAGTAVLGVNDRFAIDAAGDIVTGVWKGTAINQTYLVGQSGTNTGDELVASLTVSGTVELATGAETNTGTDATRAVTPDGLEDWTGSAQVVTVGTIGTGTWQGTAVAVAYFAHDLSGITDFRIPLSATPTMAVDGDFGIDTTVTDFSGGVLKYYDGEEMGVVAMPIAEFGTPTDANVVSYNATNDEFELISLPGGGDALTSNGLGQFAATSSSSLIGVINDETGSGLLVFNTSPTLITPALGTPASGVMTNVTGTAASLTAGNVTTNANLTGIVTSTGNATAIAAKAIAIAKLADGTDGELITWDASGVIATVAVGTATHVLTSNGTGAAPTFQAGGGGGQTQGDVLDDLNTLGVVATDGQFIVGVSAGVFVYEVPAVALASIGGEAADVDILKADVDDVLTAGFAATIDDDGTKTTGTYTPIYTGGNMKKAVNGGAHTLAPPSADSTIIIQYTNNGSAGAITTSGFTTVDGDSLTTDDGDDFFFFIVKNNGFSSLTVKALQ